MRRTNQFERTDRDITNAVLSLMDQKSFEKITVQDILDEARINRTTFYKHFPDKYAVLERLQEQYVDDLTQRVNPLLQQPQADMGTFSTAIYEYMSHHRQEMRKLITVRAEGLDMEGQLRNLFIKSLRQTGTKLTGLEEQILAGMMVQSFAYFLTTDMNPRNFPAMMLDTYLDISLVFFRIDKTPGARKQLLDLIGSLRRQDK